MGGNKTAFSQPSVGTTAGATAGVTAGSTSGATSGATAGATAGATGSSSADDVVSALKVPRAGIQSTAEAASSSAIEYTEDSSDSSDELPMSAGSDCDVEAWTAGSALHCKVSRRVPEPPPPPPAAGPLVSTRSGVGRVEPTWAARYAGIIVQSGSGPPPAISDSAVEGPLDTANHSQRAEGGGGAEKTGADGVSDLSAVERAAEKLTSSAKMGGAAPAAPVSTCGGDMATKGDTGTR